MSYTQEEQDMVAKAMQEVPDDTTPMHWMARKVIAKDATIARLTAERDGLKKRAYKTVLLIEAANTTSDRRARNRLLQAALAAIEKDTPIRIEDCRPARKNPRITDAPRPATDAEGESA